MTKKGVTFTQYFTLIALDPFLSSGADKKLLNSCQQSIPFVNQYNSISSEYLIAKGKLQTIIVF